MTVGVGSQLHLAGDRSDAWCSSPSTPLSWEYNARDVLREARLPPAMASEVSASFIPNCPPTYASL